MWVHVVIFMATAGIGIAWKAGWLRLDGFADRESIRLFLIVAVCGNCLGMALTMTSGVREIYTDGYRLEKETTGAYTEEFEVSVDGQDAEKIDVQIPEKESEEGQAAEKTEKEESLEESRTFALSTLVTFFLLFMAISNALIAIRRISFIPEMTLPNTG